MSFTYKEAEMGSKAKKLRGNYWPDVLRIGMSAKPGTVNHVTVMHDDWCALLNKRGACNCNPETVTRRIYA